MARPRKYNITVDSLEKLYSKFHNWDLVADHIGCSRSSVFRWLKELGIEKKYNW